MSQPHKKFRLDDLVIPHDNEIDAKIESMAMSVIRELEPYLIGLRFKQIQGYNETQITHAFEGTKFIENSFIENTGNTPLTKDEFYKDKIAGRVCKIINDDNEGGRSSISWYKMADPNTPALQICRGEEKLDRIRFRIIIDPKVKE